MEENSQSEGKCVFCNTVISQKEMDKHLAAHLKSMEKADTGKSTQTFCHIKVEAGPYFLQLLVRTSIELEEIDSFLRLIWLECCGHSSIFYLKYSAVEMEELVEDVFLPGIKITHEYDFGSTTSIDLKALKHYQLTGKEDVLLMSRNEPLMLLCSICHKQPAVTICPFCIDDKDGYYCSSCALLHEKKCKDFEEDTSLPVVNSPRMGVCGYTGGMIDQERDG